MVGIAYILGELDEQDVDWLQLNGEAQPLASGEALIREGVPIDAMFIVVQGSLAVSATAVGHDSFDTCTRGDVVGEMAFLDARPPAATVTAIEDSVVFVIPSAVMRAKLKLDVGFSARFHRALAVFLAHRLRLHEGVVSEREGHAGGVLEGNILLAQARFERLVARLAGERPVVLTGHDLTIEAVVRVAESSATVDVSGAAHARIARSHRIVERLGSASERVYGLNTSLGALKHLPIEEDDRQRFQRNVLMSHAAGVGAPYETEIVRAIMLARLNGMARGGSGIQPAAFELLRRMLNEGMHPVVPSRGSIGMSDLAPLAHLGLPLIGLGEVEHDGERMPSAEGLARFGLKPVELGAKDALAVCSANSASVGYGALVVARSLDALACADIAAGLSIEAFMGPVEPLAVEAHEARPYSGQLACAERLRSLLEGSSLWRRPLPGRVFEPLSFRCVAQVHGACQDALAYIRRTVETELNATGDNPVVLLDRATVAPTGNFHPAGLSIALDLLAIALAQVTSMSTQRVIKLMSQLSGLPAQLAPQPGVNLGLGVLQKTITALNAEVCFLAGPASLNFTPVADSIEDHATMATLSVSKAAELVECMRTVLAIELLCAAQAIDLRREVTLGVGTGMAFSAVRACVPFMAEDRVVASDVQSLRALVATRRLLEAVRAEVHQHREPDVRSEDQLDHGLLPDV